MAKKDKEKKDKKENLPPSLFDNLDLFSAMPSAQGDDAPAAEKPSSPQPPPTPSRSPSAPKAARQPR